jgi:hypothetical protein
LSGPCLGPDQMGYRNIETANDRIAESSAIYGKEAIGDFAGIGRGTQSILTHCGAVPFAFGE